MQPKMNRVWPIAFLCLSLLPTSGYAEEKTKDTPKKEEAKPELVAAATAVAEGKKELSKEELFSQASISKLSETYGHLINKGLDNPVLKLDFTAVIKGMQDAKAGKPSPMNEQEYEETINLLQEYAYQDLAARNLQEANKFMAENAKKDGVQELEPGKLQYLVIQDGKGDVVTENMIPSINYKGQYLDGTVFGSSDANNGPIALSLKQTIPGFRRGILGMKVGEKRRIFIHPELGYGTSGQLLPNALLIFEIEVTGVKPEPKEAPKKSSSNATANQDTAAADESDADELDVAAGETLFSDELEEDEGEDPAETYEDEDLDASPQDKSLTQAQQAGPKG
ncbi:MAG: mip-D [Chlamydiia bacterium]|nr:mip-D [Chlamydiia bacterium]